MLPWLGTGGRALGESPWCLPQTVFRVSRVVRLLSPSSFEVRQRWRQDLWSPANHSEVFLRKFFYFFKLGHEIIPLKMAPLPASLFGYFTIHFIYAVRYEPGGSFYDLASFCHLYLKPSWHFMASINNYILQPMFAFPQDRHFLFIIKAMQKMASKYWYSITRVLCSCFFNICILRTKWRLTETQCSEAPSSFSD